MGRRFQPNVVLVHYADLQHDLDGEIRRIAKRMGVEASEQVLAEVPNAGQIWLDQRAFFHRGTSGQWQDVVGEDADSRYQQVVRELIDDEELLSWLHRP